jgi:hypothetical protein
VIPAVAPQTNRPSELLVDLISSLEREAARRRRRDAAVQDLSRSQCFADLVLIRHHSYLLSQHNLICPGAGDTNGVSRWILEFYGEHLPITFDDPKSSLTLYFSPNDASLKGLTASVNSTTGELIAYQGDEHERYHALITIVPNPANEERVAVVAAGLTALGTQAAVLALSRWWKGLKEGSGTKGNWQRILKGVEKNWRPVDYEFVI